MLVIKRNLKGVEITLTSYIYKDTLYVYYQAISNRPFTLRVFQNTSLGLLKENTQFSNYIEKGKWFSFTKGFVNEYESIYNEIANKYIIQKLYTKKTFYNPLANTFLDENNYDFEVYIKEIENPPPRNIIDNISTTIANTFNATTSFIVRLITLAVIVIIAFILYYAYKEYKQSKNN